MDFVWMEIIFWSAVEEMDYMGVSRFLSFSLHFIFSEIVFMGGNPVRHNAH